MAYFVVILAVVAENSRSFFSNLRNLQRDTCEKWNVNASNFHLKLIESILLKIPQYRKRIFAISHESVVVLNIVF